MTWFFGNESEPVTAFLDSDGNQILETVGIISAQVNPTKTFSNHKLENGQVVSDNVINNQKIINIGLILNPDDYLDVYKEIVALYEANTSFTIQTRVDTYDNMYIDGMPHDEDSTIANTIAINLNFIEQQISASTTGTLSVSDVAAPSDSSTSQAGQKSAATSTKTTAQKIANYFGF